MMFEKILRMPGDARPSPSELWQGVNPRALWYLLGYDERIPEEYQTLIDEYDKLPETSKARRTVPIEYIHCLPPELLELT